MRTEEPPDRRRIGVVGLGAMGAPIAAHLAVKGHEVLGHDVGADAMARVAAAGVAVARSLEDLGRAELVLLLVPSDDDVVDVGSRLLALLQPGAALVVCSSVRPQTCRALGEQAGVHGIAVVDAALTGGVRAAEAGTVHLLVGGDPDVIDTLRPVFAAFCATIAVLGPLGAGQVGKTVNNLLHWSTIAAITEAFRLAERLGVPAPRMRAALLGGPTDSRTLQELEQFRLTWWDKDLGNAIAMADAVGAELPVAAAARDAMPAITPEVLRGLAAGLPMVRPYGHTDVSP